MRTFIAISLPEEIKGYLGQVQEKLKLSAADVKWVQAGNIHLTLKFLGEIDEEKLREVSGILNDTAKGKGTFKINLSSLGAFPKIAYPRVIWAGIDKGDNEVGQIALELEEKLSKIGIPAEDRPFSSHITLGRVRSASNRHRLVKDLTALADNFAPQGLEFTADKITLFKSTLTPKGPVYEALNEASLSAS